MVADSIALRLSRQVPDLYKAILDEGDSLLIIEQMRGGGTPEGFKAAVIADMEHRRDTNCPIAGVR